MRGKKIFYNEKTIIASVFFVFLIFFYGILYYLNRDLVDSYDTRFLPGFTVDQYNLSGLDFDHGEKKIALLSNEILKKNITLKLDDREYTYYLSKIGFEVDASRTIQEIENYQNSMSYSRKIWFINEHEDRKEFPLYYNMNEEKTREFLNELSASTVLSPVDGYFDTSEGVRYVKGVNGYQVNIEESLKAIQDFFQNNSQYEGAVISLVGDSIPAYTNESYVGIDTLTSSFVTEYDTWITARAQNLRTAMNYINGAIVEPGAVFSYFDYAGPYDKDGYVFYYKYIGNGVCQVATTVYNAALLGGHEIIARSPHAKKSPYVAGGLDATVVSYASGWNIDMQWRNTFDYPIYVKAYDGDGEVHVEFWSNANALGGKSYSMESVWLGGRSFETYRHTYLNGEEIDVSFIASTYYPKDENEPD